MTSIWVRPATLDDAARLVLREEDLAELRIQWNGSPAEALAISMGMSARCEAVHVGDELVALRGLADSRWGLHPWLMCAEAVEAHSRPLLGHARAFVTELAATGRPVFNFISKGATSSRRFVRHLGFDIVPREGPFDLFYLPHHV